MVGPQPEVLAPGSAIHPHPTARTPPAKTHHRIAVIPGDDIGQEALPEGLRVLDTVAARHGIGVEWCPEPWASCDWHLAQGEMMPADWKAPLMDCDAIDFGAVGWPATVPDPVSLWAAC